MKEKKKKESTHPPDHGGHVGLLLRMDAMEHQVLDAISLDDLQRVLACRPPGPKVNLSTQTPDNRVIIKKKRGGKASMFGVPFVSPEALHGNYLAKLIK